MAQAAIACGIHFQTFKRRAELLGVYKPNQGSKGSKKGPYVNRIPTWEILDGQHSSYQTYKLRNRLIEEKILDYVCSTCGIDEYNGKQLSLELDHINGIRHDHRVDNLRLLCPNCHSQTKTYRKKKRET